MSIAAKLDSNEIEDSSSPFYFNPSHWRAIDGVKEGVSERSGLMVLTGPTGSGKTMLMRAISDGLKENETPLFLQYASLNFREFVNFLHKSLHVGDEVHDASNKAVALRKFLYLQAERNETTVVFIDEAQNLEPDVLKMLPKLASFDALDDGRSVGLQFVLVGGSELREYLDDPEFDEVRSAISRSYELRFFTRDELKHFLEKRLEPLARTTPEPITDDAIETVGKYTGGSPRLIGMICSHAMLFAAENPGRSIDSAMIEEAAEAQMIEPVENAFAHEDEDSLTGPFSSADLKGDEQTAESDNVFDSFPEDIGAPDSDAGEAFDDAHSAADFDESDYDGSDYDDADAMDDVDDSFGDVVLNTGLQEPQEVEGKSPSMLGKLTSVFRKNRSPSKSAPTRILGSARKGGSPERQAAPTARRKVKVRTAGQHQKKVKLGLIACGVAGLALVAWLVSGPIMSGLNSAGRAVSETASRTVDTVSTAATVTASRVRDAAQSGLEGINVPGEVNSSAGASQNSPAPSTTAPEGKVVKRGWGAKVDVQNTAPKSELPAPAVNVARSALDIADIAIEKGAALAPESVRGALDVAAQDVESMRQSVTNTEASAERISELLALGDKQFENRLYIAPRGGNSYETYRQVLDIDPGNQQALNGVEKLRAFYAAKADKARAAKEWDRANRHFQTALAISKLRPVR